MTREEIRQELLKHLRESLQERQSPGRIQLMNIYHLLNGKVGRPAIDRVHRTARELLQEFVNNNLLFIGCGDDQGFPWFTVTEHGRRCLEEESLLPFDPEGYLQSLQHRVARLDSTTLIYIKEAISTYNRGFYLSAAVALGVAAEHLLLRLIEAFVRAHGTEKKKAQLEQRLAGKFVYNQYMLFKKELETIRPILPLELTKDYETHLEGVFNLIRLVRNQSGHPSGIIPEQAIVIANLQAFAFFGTRVTAMQGYFETNTI